MKILLIIPILLALTGCGDEKETGTVVVADRYAVTADGKQTLCAPNCSRYAK